MKKYIILMTLLSSLFALTACNTVDGIGEDLENAGESVQDASN